MPAVVITKSTSQLRTSFLMLTASTVSAGTRQSRATEIIARRTGSAATRVSVGPASADITGNRVVTSAVANTLADRSKRTVNAAGGFTEPHPTVANSNRNDVLGCIMTSRGESGAKGSSTGRATFAYGRGTPPQSNAATMRQLQQHQHAIDVTDSLVDRKIRIATRCDTPDGNW